MDLNAALYHGIIHQIRRVVTALGPERTDKGIDAFETGQSNWSHCFFARALADDVKLNEHGHRAEVVVAQHLGLVTTDGRPNLVPVRLVYQTFDSHSSFLTRDALKKFIVDIRDESREPEVLALIKGIQYDEAKPAMTDDMVSCSKTPDLRDHVWIETQNPIAIGQD